MLLIQPHSFDVIFGLYQLLNAQHRFKKSTQKDSSLSEEEVVRQNTRKFNCMLSCSKFSMTENAD